MLRHCPAALLSLLLAATATGQEPTPALDHAKVRRAADAAVKAGDFATAADGFRKLCDANPKDAEAWHMLGYSLHAGGKLDEALPAHLKAADFPATAAPASYNVACVHALQGRVDDAFTWLGKAVERGFDDTGLLATDPDLEALRQDARFATLSKSLQAKASNSMAAFAQTTERRSSRVAWFSRSGSPGQIAVDYAPVPWNDEYEQAVAGGKLQGKKWRLGGDFWTTLDNSMPLRFGTVEVPPGYWYLTLEQRAADHYVLALHDAAAAKKLKLDPVFADKLEGGIEVPLAHATADATADQLALTLATVGKSRTQGLLTLRFGLHELSAPVTMQVE
ncbi:MAG: hypothetical protein JNM25_07580 [Planctomycetes bacterium]|nr:hypothetical protein [Planctomycetota bacterium]